MRELYGLDISEFQGKVDFNRLNKDGYSYVILRMNKWSNSLKCSIPDNNFETNYYAAKKAGLNVGAYWFTYANTVDYAIGEAKTAIEWLKGKQFEMPIYLDIERKEQFNKGKKFCTELVKGFCDTMEKAGFFVGVYCSTFWYTNYVDEKVRERYACWIAEWASKCNYTGTYGMWQNGTIKTMGVNNGNAEVDHDVCYVDYPNIIISKGFNGYSPKVLDERSYLILGESNGLVFVLKKILDMAKQKKMIDIEQTNNITYDYAAQRAVNQLLTKWGYKPNGNVQTGFLTLAWEKIVKG